jgi:hypothetical protein
VFFSDWIPFQREVGFCNGEDNLVDLVAMLVGSWPLEAYNAELKEKVSKVEMYSLVLLVIGLVFYST